MAHLQGVDPETKRTRVLELAQYEGKESTLSLDEGMFGMNAWMGCREYKSNLTATSR